MHTPRNGTWTRWATVALAVLTLHLLPHPVDAGIPPLPEAWRSELAKVETDPTPKKLALSAHFMRSDESAHWVAYESLKDMGGVLLGVGTDPNYLIAAWMKADLVLIVDFDQVIVDIHTLYRLALVHADSPEAFVQMWSPKGKLAELVKALPDEAVRQRTLRALKMSRGVIYPRLRWLQGAYKRKKVPMCFSDPESYAHVRELAQKDRIWVWRGDLTARLTLTGLQAALKAMGQTIQVFYLTNAETYFSYTPQVRTNIAGLPFAEKSWVLRTQGKPSTPEEIADGHYRYMLQQGRDFAAWLDQRKDVMNPHHMAPLRQKTKTKGLFILPGPPPPKVKKAKKKRTGAEQPSGEPASGR